MGATYQYRCHDCGYTAEVGGGPDRGFCVETQTGVCATCNGLVDYTTRVLDPNEAAFPNVSCGVCHHCGTPILKIWNDGDPCPRCGGNCQRGPCIMDWD